MKSFKCFQDLALLHAIVLVLVKSSDAAGMSNAMFYTFRMKIKVNRTILYPNYHIANTSIDECNAAEICGIANCDALNSARLCPDKCGKY